MLTQQALRPLQRLPFCYFCGRAFDARATSDHVPPSSLFLVEDRNFPLILPAHYECNHGQHLVDQTIGQLVGFLHGQPPDPEHPRIELLLGTDADGLPVMAAGGFDLLAIIRRWVRGFHAALYREPLTGNNFMTFPPLAEGDRESGEIKPVHPLIPDFVRAIRQSRAAGALDRLVIRNGKCRYECGWLQADDGRWFCCYALDIYGWTELGDTGRHGVRGCVGSYMRPDGAMPEGATLAVRPDETPLHEPLNPFAAG